MGYLQWKSELYCIIFVQWALLNGITDNGINREMNQIYTDLQVLLIVIIRLMGFVMVWPKVIPLNSFHCASLPTMLSFGYCKKYCIVGPA